MKPELREALGILDRLIGQARANCVVPKDAFSATVALAEITSALGDQQSGPGPTVPGQCSRCGELHCLPICRDCHAELAAEFGSQDAPLPTTPSAAPRPHGWMNAFGNGCSHSDTSAGPHVPRRYGSYCTIVCATCGAFRVTDHFGDPVGIFDLAVGSWGSRELLAHLTAPSENE